MAFRRRNTPDLVLDLGTYGMRLLALEKASPGEVRLKSLATVASPREFAVSTFIENPIMEPDHVNKALKELVTSSKTKPQNVLTLLPDHSALINLMIGPPRYSKKELEDAVKEDFAPVMPLPVEHWHIIHERVGTWEDDEITLAMAIVRQNLLEIGGYIQNTGLNLALVDVNFFNVANLIEYYLMSAENKGKNIALVHLGHETTSVGVFRDGQIRSFLNRPVGGYDFSKKISKHFHVPENEADQFKCNEVFFLPEATPEQEGLYNYAVIKEVFSLLAREIFGSLEGYLSKFREFSIHEVILSGGGANFQNITVMLASNLNTNVRRVADLYSLTVAGSSVEDAKRNSLAPACGAFLRE